jgi:hypothetical protein
VFLIVKNVSPSFSGLELSVPLIKIKAMKMSLTCESYLEKTKVAMLGAKITVPENIMN